jgi:5-methylcytosine-specific restriction endonuclease McrA
MTRRISIPASVRQYVFERDCHRCCHCGATQKLTIDHIIPLAKGGADDISNLQTLCSSCNSSKRANYDSRSDRLFS